MRRPCGWAAIGLTIAVWLAAVPAPVPAARPTGPAAAPGVMNDRLERFRELAASRLALAQLGGGDGAVAEIYALVDEEIIENLESGSPFASLEFIQERLDAFGGAWGGASFRVVRPKGLKPPLTIGVLSLAGVPGSGSVRVYGRVGGYIAPVRTVTHDGSPEVQEWPPARDGSAQWAVSWAGAPSGRGSRPLRVDVWRERRDDVERVWTTLDLFPEGLAVSDFAVRRGEVRVRYELHYPGWKPGCEGQTEHEDLYRPAAGTDGVALAQRRVFNGWHRDLGAIVTRFFSALAGGDARSLGEIVPDSRLRARLPRGLRPEPACEAQSPDAPGLVVVAATDEPGRDARAPAGAPWSLWWTRAGGGAWRLSAAERVLQ